MRRSSENRQGRDRHPDPRREGFLRRPLCGSQPVVQLEGCPAECVTNQGVMRFLGKVTGLEHT
jgi:hypothetical protein